MCAQGAPYGVRSTHPAPSLSPGKPQSVPHVCDFSVSRALCTRDQATGGRSSGSSLSARNPPNSPARLSHPHSSMTGGFLSSENLYLFNHHLSKNIWIISPFCLLRIKPTNICVQVFV